MIKKLTDEQRENRALCWRMGIVAPWYLRPSQLEVYDLLLNEKNPFIEAARRFGKTSSILAWIEEKLRQNDRWIARWCFPFKNQAREVLSAEVAKLEEDCPDELKAQYQVTDSVFIFPNESKLYIRGVNEDRGESARGSAANIIVADEFGFWNDPKYIIQSVLFPQLENQAGGWLVKTSTPPPNLGHLYYHDREVARRKSRYIKKTIFDNEFLSKEQIDEIIEESGGVDSIAFRRERLCEDVGDPEMLVVPEFVDDYSGNVVPDDYERPEFFTPYVGGDSGADDFTFLVFGYYHFKKNEVVIEDELVLNGKTTAYIVEAAKKIEQELWTVDGNFIKPRARVYDASKQLIYDIYGDHKWPVQMPNKEDKLAAIHDLRDEIGARRFKIKEKCVNLRRQLKVGMWKDEKHLDFERTEGLGHLDGIAAAVYLNRHIERNFNPVPHNYGLNRETHFFNSDNTTPQSPTEQKLTRLFGNKRGIR